MPALPGGVAGASPDRSEACIDAVGAHESALRASASDRGAVHLLSYRVSFEAREKVGTDGARFEPQRPRRFDAEFQRRAVERSEKVIGRVGVDVAAHAPRRARATDEVTCVGRIRTMHRNACRRITPDARSGVRADKNQAARQTSDRAAKLSKRHFILLVVVRT
jgi:hypothetical protein